MNICPNCNHENADSSKFCLNCGTALVQNEAVVTNPVVEVSAPAFSGIYGNVEKKNNKKKIIIAAIVSVGVIGIVALVGLLTNWFGMLSPIHGLISAARDTMQAESLTVTLKMNEGNVETEGTFRGIIDSDEKEIKVLGEIEASNGEDYAGRKILIYKGDYYYYNEGSGSYEYANVNENFIDEKDFFKTKEEISGDGIDWDEIVKLLEIEKIVDADEIEPFLEKFYSEQLCDEKWLNNTLGFEKDGNTYTFNPDMKDMAEEIYDILADSDLLKSKGEEEIENLKEDVNDLENIEVSVSITTDGGYLSEIKFTLEEGKNKYSLSVEITDVNDTEIDENEIEDLREEVEDIIERNTCDECGETLFYTDPDEHGDCPECGAHGDIRYGDGVCYDCDNAIDYTYAGSGYCNKCGYSDGTYYSYYDHRLCEDCVEDYYYSDLSYGYCFNCGSWESLYNDAWCYDCW